MLLCIVKTDETKWRKLALEISVVLVPPPQLHKTSHRQTLSYNIFERMLVNVGRECLPNNGNYSYHGMKIASHVCETLCQANLPFIIRNFREL